MKLSIEHQGSYSRGQLILRTLFGMFYIQLIHQLILGLLMQASAVFSMYAFWVVLIKGKYPKGWFEFQVKVLQWDTRVKASLNNLVDGYPGLGLDRAGDNVKLDVPYPESIDRGKVLLRAFFGLIYVYIPHFFCLMFRYIAHMFITFLAWWIVLFTGNFPDNMHSFLVGTYRWMLRIQLYMMLLTDDYPPFSGKE